MYLKKFFGDWRNQILIAILTLLFIHLLFHMNERYTVADVHTTYLKDANQSMYYEFIGNPYMRSFYVTRTYMRYFEWFPDWSINLIYAGYWIIGFWYLYCFANQNEKRNNRVMDDIIKSSRERIASKQ